MKHLTTRFYYTLSDIAEKYKDILNYNGYVDVPPTVGLGAFCAAVANEEGKIASSSNWSGVDTTENKLMWSKYLWPEFEDAVLFYVDTECEPWTMEVVEPDAEEVADEIINILPRIMRWLVESSYRYSKLLSNYETIASDLLAKVESTTSINGTTNQDTLIKTNDQSVELRNDTPQEGGSFLSDPYVNEASQRTSSGKNSSSTEGASTTNSTTASDLTTPIERLEEIRQKLHNLYADWAEEFSRFVIYSVDE